LVHLPDEALAALQECRRATTQVERKLKRIIPFVFHRDGKPIKDYYTGWWGAIRRAGLKDRLPHDLRRSAARNYVRAGAHERTVMAILGHKTRSMFDRYNIVSEADLARAATLVSKAESAPTPPQRSGNMRQRSATKRKS
jgi:integrase